MLKTLILSNAKEIGKILLFIAAAAVAFVVVRNILKNAEAKKRERETDKELEKKGYNPKARKFSDIRINEFAKRIDKAIGIVTDDEEELYTIFKLIATGTLADWVALQNEYIIVEGDSLNSDLRSALNDDELKNIRQILRSIPAEYRP